MSKNDTLAFLTPLFRMSFPQVVTAKEYMERGQPTGKFNFQVQGLFEEADLKNFKVFDQAKQDYVTAEFLAALTTHAKKVWPDKDVVAIFKGQVINGMPKGWPVIKGDAIKAAREAAGKNGDAYAGQRVLNMRAPKTDKSTPPFLSAVMPDNSLRQLNRLNDADMELAKSLFVGGNYAKAAITVKAQIVSGIYYLTPYLNSIRYVKEGEKFGGGDAMSRFDGIHGGSAAHDPSGGDDDSLVDV